MMGKKIMWFIFGIGCAALLLFLICASARLLSSFILLFPYLESLFVPLVYIFYFLAFILPIIVGVKNWKRNRMFSVGLLISSIVLWFMIVIPTMNLGLGLYYASKDIEVKILKEYYPSGKLKAEIPYRSLKIDGMWKVYYENGNLMFETPWKNNIKEGIAKGYYESGGLESETTFRDGKREGLQRLYEKNGELSQEIPYRDGKFDGIATAYRRNGEFIKTPYKNGKQEGIVKRYDKNGTLIWKAIYENGKLISSEMISQ